MKFHFNKIKLFAFIISSCISILGYSQSSSGQSFHDTKGSIDVNSGGQLQFTLPIALPPGVKNVAPQINLNYISGSGNGVAGYGWNIEGITSISRVSKNIEKDNGVWGIQSNYTDVYSFNGQRLIIKSGQYGYDGAEYITEKYSNLKIKSYGSITGKPWSGPLYWEITFEDGSQAWYGTLPNSLNANTDLQYNIVKWKDVNGNYITYEYDQTEITNHNITLIKNIKWGGNENLNKDHFNSIDFFYSVRNQKENAYHQGILHTQKNILQQISVIANQDQFKKYIIDYTDLGTSYQFVNKITEYNSDNEAANPVIFSYAPAPSGSEEPVYHENITNYNTKKYADFNLDGEADYIEFVTPGVINYKSSVYAGVGPISLQYDASKFSADDFKKAISITFKKNNFVKKSLGLVIPVIKPMPSSQDVTGNNNIELQVYSVDISNRKLQFEYSKTVSYNQYDLGWEVDNTPPTSFICHYSDLNIELFNYDYNGDGLSEVMIDLRRTMTCTDMSIFLPTDPGTGEGGSGGWPNGPQNPNDYITTNNFYTSLLFELDESISDVESTYTIKKDMWNTPVENPILKKYFADLNGDGIQDVIEISKSGVLSRTFNIKKNSTGNYSTNQVENFYAQSLGYQYEAALFGDFNGDSKADILIPQANKSYNWDLYISDGKNFNKSFINNFIFYQSGTETLNTDTHNTFYENGCTSGMIRMFQYQASDIDGDGKSEILVSNILMLDHEWNAHRDKEWTNVNVTIYSTNKLVDAINKSIIYNPSYSPFPGATLYATHNIDSTDPIQTNSDIIFYRTKNSLRTFPQKVIPFSTLSLNRDNQQIILTGKPVDCQGSECDKNYVLHYNYTHLPSLARITHIKQGEVTTIISYRGVNSFADSNFYKAIQAQPYPYMELDRIPLSSVVSSMDQFTNNLLIFSQDFRYRGILSNFHGRGMIGFRQFVKSSWYASGYDNTKIWSGVEVDPLNESIPIKEWTIRTNDESKIFPNDLSIGNNQLLSFKEYKYKIDKLLNGVLITTVTDTDRPKVVTAINPHITTSKDFVSNVKTVHTVEAYNNCYFPTKSVDNVNDGFSIVTSEQEYYPSDLTPGSNYSVSKLKTKISTLQSYGDIKKSKEEYTYDNNLLKTFKTWNRDDSGYLLEVYNYDGFGNVLQKITSNSIDTKTQNLQSEYESKGRFVTKKKDNLGLETNIKYNDWGQILIQTDPLGNTITNTYDGWGKILSVTSNLSGTTSYQYEKLQSGEGIKVKETNPIGDENTTYTNNIGQNYKTTTKAFSQGKYVSMNISYDPMGRKIKESEPYFEGQNPTQWNTISYDDNYFPAKVKATSFNGKQTETSFSGLTTTVKELNGYGRTTSKTTDALGNVISTTDTGGIIQFNYNAAGEQIQAKYEENIVTTKFDTWGRKSLFYDPSNGEYKYEYNGFGQVIKITSPKGKKEFVYNNLGQLTNQIEKSSDGISTSKDIKFNYDGFGRVISRSGTSNGKAYLSKIEFDTYGRIQSSLENSNGRTYIQKGYFYDDKSRIKSYTKSLSSSGITTEVTLVHAYNNWNGELYQLMDKQTGLKLWELQDTNAKGQVLTSLLGAATVSNVYNNNGFLNNINHSSAVKPSILQISYSFDAIKNELKSRTTEGDFSISENFEYDNNNRLTYWTNPRTGQTSSNTYDIKGRILKNDQLGEIKYENSDKIYQSTGMSLNATGVQNYTNDLIQHINYNENNDPILINGQKGDVFFEYGLTSMRQRVSYGGTIKPNQISGNFTKLYSEDGSFEVTIDNTTKLERHILYIVGTPYESDILFVKNYKEKPGSYKFLHKDYLGSVLAITDEKGVKLEQRHFDAWGNLTHLQIGSKTAVTDKIAIIGSIARYGLIVDRGYTSHEHFLEVGIIHMNGRLYDPLLRRFLNADENIQEPTNTQNYNKYGYVMNNPLLYNDPSGEIFGASAFASAIIIGAFIGTASYIINTAITGSRFTLMGYFKAEFFGAASGAATYGIGSAFTSAPMIAAIGNGGGSAILQGLAHGITQGVLSLMQGGDLSQAGMAATTAFVTSGLMSGLSRIVPSVTNSLAGSMAIGGAIGGITSELSGGNFWQGVAIGAIVAGVSHVINRIETQTDYADADGSSGGAANDNKGDVLNWFNEKDGGLYKVAQNDSGAPKGTVRIYTHGNKDRILDPSGNKVLTAERFDKLLMERSPAWRNYRENGGSIKIELMSCNTGRMGNGFASMISKTFRFSSVLAPNNYYVAYTRNGVSWGGVAGQYNLINPGRWNYFVNGQNLSNSGLYTPKHKNIFNK